MKHMSDNTDELVEAMATVLRLVSTQKEPAAPSRKLLRVDDVAEQLSISPSHVYALMRSGDIRSVKLGKARRVPQSEVDRIMRTDEAG
jgi:excisionase family DNA binding protein